MNSLNLLSASVLGQNRPEPRRPRSNSEGSKRKEQAPSGPKRATSQLSISSAKDENGVLNWLARPAGEIKVEKKEEEDLNEKTPLLSDTSPNSFSVESKASRSRVTIFVQRIAGTFIETVRWVVTKIFAPGAYILALFYTENGHFSPVAPIRKLRRDNTSRGKSKPSSNANGATAKAKESTTDQMSEKRQLRSSTRMRTASAVSSDSEADNQSTTSTERGAGTVSSSDESTTSKRSSIRIKQNEESTRRRRQKKRSDSPEEVIAKELKSPTSPNSNLKFDRYPHKPTPPRPLIPRRQPSYSNKPGQSSGQPRKTLVLDLDETLIHSMAKGGRMSTGHMVEVKLSAPAAYNGVSLGPQHPILYYVHKRPHCDEFLRKISQWYNLVIFTASVQEYADPVIDWLELERKYFSARYYRQHCTFRNGAYIKDLGSIEPDLSKVMILDNSPLSYIFHEDNAIPIEGWINDPTDNDLLHLVPLFEGLQYVTDVRALLGLRRGQVDQGLMK